MNLSKRILSGNLRSLTASYLRDYGKNTNEQSKYEYKQKSRFLSLIGKKFQINFCSLQCGQALQLI